MSQSFPREWFIQENALKANLVNKLYVHKLGIPLSIRTNSKWRVPGGYWMTIKTIKTYFRTRLLFVTYSSEVFVLLPNERDERLIKTLLSSHKLCIPRTCKTTDPIPYKLCLICTRRQSCCINIVHVNNTYQWCNSPHMESHPFPVLLKWYRLILSASWSEWKKISILITINVPIGQLYIHIYIHIYI